MDGLAVTGEPSQTSERLSLASVLDQLCPQYMAMGMTYAEFWDSPTSVHKAYREAFMIKNRNEEFARWRQGAYFLKALGVALSGFSKNKTQQEKYPGEPWPLTQSEQDERDRINYQKALAQRRAASDAALKRRAEQAKEARQNGSD